MSGTQQPEALRLADKYEIEGFLQDQRYAKDYWCSQAAIELRRQHARIEELEAQLAAIGAGGVEPLRKREASTALAVPMAEAWEQSAADTEHQRTGAGLHFNQGVAEGLRICAKDLRTSLAATPAAVDMGIPMTESAVPKMRPEAWLATFRPKGMLSSHSVAGTNLEELKRSVPSDSKFKPLYAQPILTIVGMSTTAQPQQGGTQQ